MKRFVSILLALMLLTLTLLSCAQPGDAGNAETTPTDTTAAVGGDVTTPGGSETTANVIESTVDDNPVSRDPLPEGMRFDGETIRIISQDRDWVKDEVTVDDMNGEPVNDAVYNRLEAVKARLGVKITNFKTGGSDPWVVPNMIVNLVLAGTDDYDLVFNSTYTLIAKTTEGVYHNLYDVPNLDLENEWWAQYYNKQVSIGNAQYICAGDANISLKRMTFVTMFNQAIFDQYGVEDIYQVVRDGKWTVDYQTQLSTGMYQDLNGNNTRDESDFFGFITNASNIGVDPYFASCELPILSKTTDNTYVYSFTGERIVDAATAVCRLIWENDGAWSFKHTGAGDAEQNLISDCFAEGRAAMVTLRLLHTSDAKVRNMKDKYGILPIPKLDENQQTYFSHAHDQFCSIAVPRTVKEDRLEAIGAMLEYFAYQSREMVVPEYYEVTLKSKYVADEESGEMLDLIFANMNVNAGNLYYNALDKIADQWRSTIGGNTSASLPARLKGYERMVPKSLETLQESILKNQE